MRMPINSAQIRRNNIKTLLLTISSKGPISKREIQSETGLSWGAVSAFCNELLEKRLIVMSGKRSTSVGRKPDELDINPADNFVIGIDLSLSQICGVLTDLKGRIVKRWLKPFPDNGKDSVLRVIMSLLEEIIERELVKKHILGIGFAVSGIVDSENGISVYLPTVEGWSNVSLKDIIEERFKIPTVIMHDPNCMMIAEKNFGDSFVGSAKSAALLRIDDGIGMSLISDGNIYTGSTGMAGEIGHIAVEENGYSCVCGKRGCLEEYATHRGVVNIFLDRVKSGDKTGLDFSDEYKITCDMIANAARNGDRMCRETFIRAGGCLGIVLSHIYNTYNPEIVVLIGGFLAYADLFYEVMKEKIGENVYPHIPVKIKISNLGNDAAAHGAAIASLESVIHSAGV